MSLTKRRRTRSSCVSHKLSAPKRKRTRPSWVSHKRTGRIMRKTQSQLFLGRVRRLLRRLQLQCNVLSSRGNRNDRGPFIDRDKSSSVISAAETASRLNRPLAVESLDLIKNSWQSHLMKQNKYRLMATCHSWSIMEGESLL